MSSEENDGLLFWRRTLNSAKYVVAPMVDASELAWRMLSRKYGAQLCYTPMLHSNVFVKDARYRRENLISCESDRPLIVQFCANNPEVLGKACKLAAPYCDAIDLNLGCPQAIARKGQYGAYLMEDWDLIDKLIRAAVKESDVPITAKMRVFEDVEKTVKYAQMLQNAGVKLLTVHGRTRDQKGPLTGVASWDHIKAVSTALSIPVFANGNIQFLNDVEHCLVATGAKGVMSAEGNLHNPAMFSGISLPVWQMALEYLNLVKQYPCPMSYCRGHVFKLMHHIFTLPVAFDLRYDMSKASNIQSMIEVTEKIRLRFLQFSDGEQNLKFEPDSNHSRLPLSIWLCQPYVRISTDEHKRKMALCQVIHVKRSMDVSSNEKSMSKKKLKKLQKNPNKKFEPGSPTYKMCACRNPRGGKCEFELCKSCCKSKCYSDELDCKGHGILIKTKRQKALMLLKIKEGCLDGRLSPVGVS